MNPIKRTIVRAALAKINECRTKCPGVGGDVDAMNLCFLLKKNEESEGAFRQATDRLESLSESLKIDAKDEIEAMRQIFSL